MGENRSMKDYLAALPPRPKGRPGLCAALGVPDAPPPAPAPLQPANAAAPGPFAAFAYSPPVAAAATKRARALVSDDEASPAAARRHATLPNLPARPISASPPATAATAPAPALAPPPPQQEDTIEVSSTDDGEAGEGDDDDLPPPQQRPPPVTRGGGGGGVRPPPTHRRTPPARATPPAHRRHSSGSGGGGGGGGVAAAVEAIGADLRAALSRGAAARLVGDRVTGAGDGGGGAGAGLLSATQIAAACCRTQEGGSSSDEEEEDNGVAWPAAADAPAGPPPPLKPYQVVGVNFLALLRSKGLSAILADEMGLGKSAQAASFLAVRAASGGEDPGRPFLVVVPASLLDNWARELAAWAPALRVARYYGPGRARVRAAAKARVKAGRTPGADVFLASIAAFSSDSAAARTDRAFLRSVPWSIVVVDEAHAIKNAGAARSTKLASVAVGAEMRVCLTGTPLQNRPAELKALLGFLMPTVFEDGGGGGGGGGGDEEDGADDDDGGEDAASLRRLLAPFILRRLKSEVAAQLVPKTVEAEAVAMVAAQAEVYSAAVAALREEARGGGGAPAVAGGGGGGGGASAGADAGRALVRALGPARAAASFTLLRKLALHPLLTRSGRFSGSDLATLARAAAAADVFGTPDVDRVRAHLDTLSDFELHRLGQQLRLGQKYALPRGAVGAGSGKASRLAELLPQLRAAGHRVLLFSQWTTVLDLMEVLLDDAGLPWSRLDGATPVAERLDLVDAFNAPGSPTFCMLLSTGAGGQGLNLTGADTVIIHDVAWNPSVDRQAEDRAHRLGQERPVRVIRLVTAGTVDEGVAASAARKLALADAVLGEDDGGEGGGGGAGAEPALEIKAVLAQVLLGVQGGGGG